MMQQQELYNLWLPVCVKLFGGETETHRELLDELLGVDEWKVYKQSKFYHQDVPMAEDVKDILTKILGPHGKTMLKVWRIKMGLEP